MGATKESPAVQMLGWAVGKLDEASKIDWVDKFATLTASKPAYLRNGMLGAAASSLPAPARPDPGPSSADLDAAMAWATRAEAKAEALSRRVSQLEQQLAALSPHDDVEPPAESDEDHHDKHWWSRH